MKEKRHSEADASRIQTGEVGQAQVIDEVEEDTEMDKVVEVAVLEVKSVKAAQPDQQVEAAQPDQPCEEGQADVVQRTHEALTEEHLGKLQEPVTMKERETGQGTKEKPKELPMKELEQEVEQLFPSPMEISIQPTKEVKSRIQVSPKPVISDATNGMGDRDEEDRSTIHKVKSASNLSQLQNIPIETESEEEAEQDQWEEYSNEEDSEADQSVEILHQMEKRQKSFKKTKYKDILVNPIALPQSD